MSLKALSITVTLSLAAFAQAARAQGQPPAGSYPCMVSRMTFSPVVGPAGPLMLLAFDPSVLGTMRLDGRGGYSVARGGGRYAADASTGRFDFATGPLQGWPALFERNDDGDFVVRLAKSKNEQPNPSGPGVGEHRCTLRDGAGTPNAPGGPTRRGGPTTSPRMPTAPRAVNLGLKGTLTFRESWGSNKIVDVEVSTGRVVSRFEGSGPHASTTGETVFVNGRGLLVIAGRDGAAAASFKDDVDTPDNPVLSPDGSRVAYRVAPSYWDSRVVVRTRDGRVVATFKGMTDPAWAPDGRLVMAAATGYQGAQAGLFMTDRELKKLTRLDPNLDDAAMPAVSPDGSRVAFVHHGHVWELGLDGLRQLTSSADGEKWPAWSPDGRALAVAGKGQHSVVMLVAEGSQTPVELKNERGRSMQTSGRITWR